VALNSSQLAVLPMVQAIAQAVDPTIIFDGDINGSDLTAIIAQESNAFSTKILASDINAGNWVSIGSQLGTLSTNAGHTPGTIS
jgi:hypothetical protein